MKQKTMGGDNLQHFVNRLVEEKNLQGLDSDVIQQIKQDLYDRVEDRVNAAILANVPPEKISFFEKLLDQSDQKEIQDFCQRNIWNLDQIIAKELMDFREVYLRN